LQNEAELVGGLAIGHWSDHVGQTGCTVILACEGAIASYDLRGGGPGTRETDLLSPAASAQAIHGLVLTGGSAFGLAAADGALDYLVEQGWGLVTPAGRVPLVPAAVVYDLAIGDSASRPDRRAGYLACKNASAQVHTGTVGAGTGCTVGKLLGSANWTKGGLGYSQLRVRDATLQALAVVNPFGDVLEADGTIAAGVRDSDGFQSTSSLLLRGTTPRPLDGQSTTLVCLITDAKLTKTEAQILSQAAGAGIARCVVPSATPVDGDACFCISTGQVQTDTFLLSATAAGVAEAAIRNAVWEATGTSQCPARSELGF
jgi:L-aminopeptidase/D-esterase-like protein